MGKQACKQAGDWMNLREALECQNEQWTICTCYKQYPT